MKTKLTLRLGVLLIVVGVSVARAVTTNLLRNGSFEVCTIENLPDFWGNGRMGISAPRWVLDADSWRAHWGVVDSTSHSGQRSLRIDCPGDSADLSLHARWVDLEKLNVPYTLSVWLKSDRADMPVGFGFQPPLKEVKVSTEWARYWVTGSPYDKTIAIVLAPRAGGVIWVDDVQFELGGDPTDYAPSPSDASLTGEAVHRTVPDTRPFRVKPVKKNPSQVVRIDAHRRFLINDVPFIPFATAWEHLPTREILLDTAKAGFNAVVIWVGNDTGISDVRKLFDDASSFGLKVIVGMSGGITTENRTLLLTSLRNHPALIAWNVCDEPLGAELWREMKMLAREIRQLTPVLCSLETAPTVPAAPSDIHLLGKAYKGQRYVVAANTLSSQVSANINVSGGGTVATVLFENRRVNVVNGVIHDTFAGYQRHVYQFPATVGR